MIIAVAGVPGHELSMVSPELNAVGEEKKGSKLSSGFAIEDTAGIQKAIPKCIKEAIDSVRQ